MTVVTKAWSILKGRKARLPSATAAVMLLIPVPPLGFIFLSLWLFSVLPVNPPIPAATSIDGGGGPRLIVDREIAPPLIPTGGSVNPGAISFLTAQRDISVG